MEPIRYKFIPKACKYLEGEVNNILIEFNYEKKAKEPQMDIKYASNSLKYLEVREKIYRRLKDRFTDIGNRYGSAQELLSNALPFIHELKNYSSLFDKNLKKENDDTYLLSINIDNIRVKVLDVFTTFVNLAEEEDPSLKNRVFVSFNHHLYKSQFNLLKDELTDKYTIITHDVQSERRQNDIEIVQVKISFAKVFISFIGEDFTNSKRVVTDIDIARSAKIPIIFVRLDPNINKPLEPYEYTWIENFDIAKIKNELDRFLNTESQHIDNISIKMLADFAIENSKEDLLNFTAYSSAIAGIIDNPETGTPITIAINAPWGAGKSSLGKLIQDKLRNKPASNGKYPHVTCWFNAWMHDDAQNIGSSFISFLIHEINKKRSWFKRFVNPMPYDILSKNEKTFRMIVYWFVVILTSVGLSFLIINLINYKDGFPKGTGELLKAIPNFYEKEIVQYSSLALFFVTLIKITTYLLQAVKSVSSFINDPAEIAKSGQLEKTRNQLRRFIKQSLPKKSRFVIFVDDIERCHPPSGIDLLEIINQLLSFPEVVVVVMADIPLLAANAEIKYDKLSEKQVYGSFGRQYLQKIIQLQFDIPLQSQKGISTMIDNVITNPENTATTKQQDPINSYTKIVLSLFQLKYFSPLTIANNEDEKSNKILRYFISICYLPLRIIPIVINFFVYPKWIIPEELYNLKSKRVQLLFKINFWYFSLFYLLVIPCFFFSLKRSMLYLFSIIGTAILLYILLRIYAFKKYNELISDLRNGQEQAFKEILNVSDLSAISEEIEFKNLEQDSNLFQMVRNEALLYLDSLNLLLPRNAKRITNKIRLFIYVAYKKELIRTNNDNLHKHIAKWIVFQEKWPELYMHIFKHHPQVEMEKIEVATINFEIFNKYIETYCPSYLHETNELKGFLIDDNIKLSDKLGLLLYETNGEIKKSKMAV